MNTYSPDVRPPCDECPGPEPYCPQWTGTGCAEERLAIGIRNLSLYTFLPLRLPDGTEVVYYLSGTWQVREWSPGFVYYVGRLIYETPAAIEIAAWLNQNQVSLVEQQEEEAECLRE